MTKNTYTKPLHFESGDYEIDGNLAARILEEAHFHGQRETDDVFVGMHVENIRRKLMLEGSQIAFCRIEDSYYLVNGKHRITAVALSGVTVRFSVIVYDCENESDVRSIYARFDSIQRPRTTNQILNAYELDDRLGLMSRTANALFNAIPLIENNMRPLFYKNAESSEVRKRLGIPEVRLEIAMAWADQAREYEKMIDPAHSRLKVKLLSAHAMAVAMVTIRYQSRRANDFWSGVALNDGLRRGDPRQALVQCLLGRDLKARLNAVMITGTAWNAWFRGSDLMSVKVSPDTEIRILGTPFDGKVRR